MLLNSQSPIINASSHRSLNQCFTLVCNTATTLITADMVAVSTAIARLTAFVLIAIVTAVPRPLPVSKAAPTLSVQTASRPAIEYKLSNEQSNFLANVFSLCKDHRTENEILKCIEERSPLAAYCIRKSKHNLVYCRDLAIHAIQETHGCIFYTC